MHNHGAGLASFLIVQIHGGDASTFDMQAGDHHVCGQADFALQTGDRVQPRQIAAAQQPGDGAVKTVRDIAVMPFAGVHAQRCTGRGNACAVELADEGVLLVATEKMRAAGTTTRHPHQFFGPVVIRRKLIHQETL